MMIDYVSIIKQQIKEKITDSLVSAPLQSFNKTHVEMIEENLQFLLTVQPNKLTQFNKVRLMPEQLLCLFPVFDSFCPANKILKLIC